jgi:carbon-monoxide dehydrogenase medium subunit
MVHVRSIAEFEYRLPESLAEALELLGPEALAGKVLAGGTDLVLQMKQGLVRPSLVVDVKQIPELNRLEWSEPGGLVIGAAVPFVQVLAFAGLPKAFSILLEACSSIGSMQIRNRGTIGGNLCNAAPSADSAPPLLCLGAEVVLASSQAARAIPLEQFFLAPGKTALAADELLVEIKAPTPPARSAGRYLRHSTREEMDIAVAGVASFITEGPQAGRLKTVRIALGAVAPTPVRAYRAEAALVGQAITRKTIEEAAGIAAGEANPISDMRGSGEYRREMVRVLVRRTLTSACEELGLEI